MNSTDVWVKKYFSIKIVSKLYVKLANSYSNIRLLEIRQISLSKLVSMTQSLNEKFKFIFFSLNGQSNYSDFVLHK